MAIFRHLSRLIIEENNDGVFDHSLSIISLDMSSDGEVKSYTITPFSKETESVIYHDSALCVRIENGKILFDEVR